MSDLAIAAQDYLRVRRALGFKLAHHGRLLPKFVRFVEDANASVVTCELALDWATQAHGHPAWCQARLSIVRGFARYLFTIEPRTQVPPRGLLDAGRVTRRRVPYVYSNDEIARLMAAARDLRPLPAATYATLIGLLAATGMRVGEVIRLDDDDVDQTHRVLVVRDTKYAKSREVPLHETTLEAINHYKRRRDELCRRAPGPSLLVSTTGTRLSYKVVQPTFAKLCQQADITPRSERCRPRLHDLRHTFAVRTVIEWCRTGQDVHALMPRLSTVLGHGDPSATYWYLEATPELLALAAGRLAESWEDHR